MLKLKHCVKLVSALIVALVSVAAGAVPYCKNVFPSALATYDGGVAAQGTILLGDGTVIESGTNGFLTTKGVLRSGTGTPPRCDGGPCFATNTDAITPQEAATIPDVTFSPITNGLVPNTLQGDYFFDREIVQFQNTTYNVTAPTRLFMRWSQTPVSVSALTIPAGATFNIAPGAYLAIYIDGAVTVEANATVPAAIYATRAITIRNNATINGALTSGKAIEVGSNTQITLDQPYDVPGICQSVLPEPLAEFRFDEISWQEGLFGQVIDSQGGQGGGSRNVQPVSGHMCNAADFSVSGTSDFIQLPRAVLDGLGDFSISMWVNSDVTNRGQTMVSGAGNNGLATDNNVWMWFTNHTAFRPYLDDYTVGNIATDSISQSRFVHLVWTRNRDVNCLYLDGVLQGCRGAFSRALNQISVLLLGQDQDSTGGGFSSSQAFDGLLDELIVFDAPLDSLQVVELYNNQNNYRNFDGTRRVCPQIVPRLDIRFDESNWSSPDAVKDSSGNAYHGNAERVLPVEGLLCNAADFSADSITDLIELPGAALDGAGDFTIMMYFKSDIVATSTLFSAARDTPTEPNLGANEATWLFTNNEQFWPHITANPFDTRTQFSSNTQIRNNQWNHVVWTRRASTATSCFILNGVEQGCTRHQDGDDTRDLIVEAIILGQDQDSLRGGYDISQGMRGLMDELLIFDGVLPLSKINEIDSNLRNSRNWDGSPRSCEASIDHYRLELSDAEGLTCAAKPITLKACANDTCDELFSQPVTVDLLPDSTSELAWSPSETVTFTGQLDLELGRTTQGTETLGYDTASPTAPLRCYIGGNQVTLSSCQVTFRDTGFIFNNDSQNNTTIVSQLSGKPSDQGFNASAISLQAVRTDNQTGQCQSVFSPNTDVDVELRYNCSAGNTCSAPLVLGNNGNNSNVTSGYQNVSLRFGADAKANLTLTYPDAGRLSLSARKTLELVPGLNETLQGSSNEFTIRPFGLSMDFIGEDKSTFASDASGPLLRLTGEPFAVRLSAKQWVAGEDTNNDGQPDNFDALDDNPNAAHFAGEFPELTLAQMIAPAGGVSGSLNVDAAASFNNGVADVSYTYDEVGVISINAGIVDGDYQGAGNVVGQTNPVGRFAPSDFALISSSVIPGCGIGSTAMTYSGQDFGITLQLAAQNHNGETMRNYRDGFAKAQALIGAENNEPGNYVSNASFSGRIVNLDPINWPSSPAGEVNFTDNTVQVSRLGVGSPESPYNDFDLALTLTDIEGANLIAADEDPFSATSCTNCSWWRLGTDAKKLYYGRLATLDGYGSDLEPLRLPLVAQYYDGNDFVLNPLENCLATSQSNLTQVAPSSPALAVSQSPAGSVTLSNGEFAAGEGIFITPNGSGEFIFQYNAPNFLEWDWVGDGSRLEPQSRLRFGRFRGNDRVIYWRETP